MTDSIGLPSPSGTREIPLATGEVLFVLGANGSGKSSLMHHLATTESNTHWSAAHRQLWMTSAAPELSPTQLEQTVKNHNAWIRSDISYRWAQPNNYAMSSTQALLTELHSTQRLRDRRIVKELDEGNAKTAEAFRGETEDVLNLMTRLFKTAGMRLSFVLGDGEKFMVSRETHLYPINELSDGERSAFILFANILTQPPGTLFLIDEPERHLHRSIACPLLEAVFQQRGDCRFIVSTHELTLPLDFPDSRVLLLRSCQFDSLRKPISWEADLTKASTELAENLKVDIWGSRRDILFTEGDRIQTRSLDVKLYRLLFPEATIRPKGSWRSVVDSVRSLGASEEFTWVRPHGLVDGDQRHQQDVLGSDNVHCLEVHSIESLYYHPTIQRVKAEPRCKQLDNDLDECLSESVRLTIREYQRSSRLTVPVKQQGLSNGDYAKKIITTCAIKRTNIPDTIARSLGFQSRQDYENTVRDRLVDSESLREQMIALDSGLQDLSSSIGQTG